MKLFISADIEGTPGISCWAETEPGKPEYDYFRKAMTEDVRTAAEAALGTGYVDEVIVKDAHDSARNIIPDAMPEGVRLIRGWASQPGGMMQGIEGCDAAICVGYHSGSYSGGSPLQHTTEPDRQKVIINGTLADEFRLNSLYAAYRNVPVILTEGDAQMCEDAKRNIPGIVTVPVMKGFGGATVSLSPQEARRHLTAGIRKAVEALRNNGPQAFLPQIPDKITIDLEFTDPVHSKAMSFYPGAERIDPMTVRYRTTDLYEMFRFLFFIPG